MSSVSSTTGGIEQQMFQMYIEHPQDLCARFVDSDMSVEELRQAISCGSELTPELYYPFAKLGAEYLEVLREYQIKPPKDLVALVSYRSLQLLVNRGYIVPTPSDFQYLDKCEEPIETLNLLLSQPNMRTKETLSYLLRGVSEELAADGFCRTVIIALAHDYGVSTADKNIAFFKKLPFCWTLNEKASSDYVTVVLTREVTDPSSVIQPSYAPSIVVDILVGREDTEVDEAMLLDKVVSHQDYSTEVLNLAMFHDLSSSVISFLIQQPIELDAFSYMIAENKGYDLEKLMSQQQL